MEQHPKKDQGTKVKVERFVGRTPIGGKRFLLEGEHFCGERSVDPSVVMFPATGLSVGAGGIDLDLK